MIIIKEIIENRRDIKIAIVCLSIRLGKNPPPSPSGIKKTKSMEIGTQTRVNLYQIRKISSLRK